MAILATPSLSVFKVYISGLNVVPRIFTDTATFGSGFSSPSVTFVTPGMAESSCRTRSKSTALRALYVNRWASQSRKRMAKLVAAADSTEVNAFVIDMKDEFGLNYKTQNADFAKNAGTASVATRRPWP